MIKKILVGASIVMVALVLFGAGIAFSQTNLASAAGLAGFGRGGMMGGKGGQGGQGQVHEYAELALAARLGMTEAEVETAQASGKSFTQIALDKGTKQADVTALLADVYKTALAKAVTDKLLTQAQADAMLQTMTANGFVEMGGGMMGGRGNGGMGQIHNYVEQALASKLGMTEAEVETALASGKSMSQIAIDKGTAQADVTALLTDVHKTALAQAVTDKLLTQAQADAMLQNMIANGFNDANGGMMGGRGYGRGHGGMMGDGGMMGGRGTPQQPTVTATPGTIQ